ncbi:MAG: hypothetical protein JO047_00840 [Alphaproteobacteria bacterium]|nr:hypothetical protein [Alphaproteobacteria bacterium]
MAASAIVPRPSFGQIAPVHWERTPAIKDAYAAALGREPSAAELYFWALYPDTPPGIINAQSVFSALLQTLENSQSEREATARRAVDAVFQREEAADAGLRAYIDDPGKPPLRRALADLRAQREGGGYRGLVAWLARPEIRRHFIAETGMSTFIGAAR